MSAECLRAAAVRRSSTTSAGQFGFFARSALTSVTTSASIPASPLGAVGDPVGVGVGSDVVVLTVILSKCGAQSPGLLKRRLFGPAVRVTVAFRVPPVLKPAVEGKVTVFSAPPLTLSPAVRAALLV